MPPRRKPSGPSWPTSTASAPATASWSLELLHPGGLLIFLLRTNFLESEKRFKWWQEHPLSGLYTLHKRPSFTGRGTDATSYSWFVWERGGGTGCIGHQTIKTI